MTPNEKKALIKFREIKQGNTVTVAARLRVTINYAYDVCNKLCEQGYLERLSPGRFALYRVTPSGEKQVRGEGEPEREIGSVLGPEEEVKKAIEEIDEYECSNCGIVIRAEEIECPKCGIILEGFEEEPEPFGSAQDKLREEAPQPTPKSPILDHPSVPEDWKVCSWRWK